MTKALVYYISKEENSKIFDAAKRELKNGGLKPDKRINKRRANRFVGDYIVLTQIMLAIYPLTDAIKYWIGPDQKTRFYF